MVATPTRARRTGIVLTGCAVMAMATDIIRNWGGITVSGIDSTMRMEETLLMLRRRVASSLLSYVAPERATRPGKEMRSLDLATSSGPADRAPHSREEIHPFHSPPLWAREGRKMG